MSASAPWPAVPLACPVRGCGLPLAAEPGGRSLSCDRRHTFDRARTGYVSLVQPQDRRSVRAGDPPEAAAARSRWLARGHMNGLMDALASDLAAAGLPCGARVVEAGCGDGWALAGLAERLDVVACGLDLSKPALDRAARRAPRVTWVASNADRRLPFPDGSLDAVTSIFGRRNPREFARVLRPAGLVAVAVPGPDDLVELREVVLGRADRADRVAALREEFAGFSEVSRRRWSVRPELDHDAIEELLASTYRGARHSQRPRAAAIRAASVTLAADLLVFRRP